MAVVSFRVADADKEWIQLDCLHESIKPSFSQTDGLVGGSEWLQIALPLVTVSIPCITKILLKIIDKYGPSTVTCGEITVNNVRKDDVTKVLSKMCTLQQKMNESAKSHE